MKIQLKKKKKAHQILGDDIIVAKICQWSILSIALSLILRTVSGA